MTPRDWISKLNDATRMLETGKDLAAPPLLKEMEMSHDHSELNFAQVFEISLEKLNEVQAVYLKGEMKEEPYISFTNEIADGTLEWLKAVETKRNRSFQHRLRKIALALSLLFSLALIGIPVFLKLRKEDRLQAAEMDRLKQAILQAKETNAKAMIAKKLEELPSIIENIKKQFTDHRRLELINFQLLADWQDDENIPEDSRLKEDAEFESDIKKGASFRRIDRLFNIDDKEPLPSFKLEGRKRVQEGAKLLNALIRDPEDLPWKTALQLAVSHANLITAFKAALSAFNIEAGSIAWETNGKYYSIKSIFSEQFPPVILEIIRHAKTERIERVNVKVQGLADIVSYNTSGHEPPKILIPHAIEEELRYSIIMGENRRPAVADLHSEMAVKK